MKRTFTKLVIVLLFLSINKLNAQVLAANYSFSSNIATYSSISNGNDLGDDTNDDNLFDDIPIGFTFTYCGVAHSSVCISSNGYFKFGTPIQNASMIPLSNSGGDDTLIAILAEDLQSNTGGSLTYTTIGTAPNQIFIVQWEDYTYYGESDNFYFQIRLHQTSNVIEYSYGSFYCDATSNAYQCGLRGNTNVDFKNRRVIESLQTWATSIAGSANNDIVMVSPTPFIPSSGQRYVWSPPCPAPTVNIVASTTNVCQGGSVTFTASGATSYTWNTAATTNTISATLSVSTTFTAYGTSIPGCTAQAISNISVTPGPTISVNAQPTNSFCPGQTGTLVANGANNGFTWTPTGSTFAIIFVAPTANTIYTVVGANTQGCTSSQTVALFMTTCTSVYDPESSNELATIYPNPSNGSFIVELNNGSEKQIEVTDLTGRVVLTEISKADKTHINISALSNGVYYIRLNSNNESKVFKIIKE